MLTTVRARWFLIAQHSCGKTDMLAEKQRFVWRGGGGGGGGGWNTVRGHTYHFFLFLLCVRWLLTRCSFVSFLQSDAELLSPILKRFALCSWTHPPDADVDDTTAGGTQRQKQEEKRMLEEKSPRKEKSDVLPSREKCKWGEWKRR